MKKLCVGFLSIFCLFCLFSCGKPSYTVNFMVDDTVYSTKTTEGQITLPDTPTKEGFTFQGWFLDSAYSTPLGDSVSSDVLIYAKWEEIPCYFGHTKGELHIENEFSPSCTAEGGYQEVFYCTVCNIEISRTDKILSKVEHEFSDTWTVDTAATCAVVGSKSRHCLHCDAKTDVTEIPTYAHQYGSWATVSAATCSQEGLRKKICSVCLQEQTEPITKKAHSFGSWSTVSAPTCQAEGQRKHVCLVCQEEVFETMAKTTTHNYSTDWTIDREPTCSMKGEKSRHCVVCDARTSVSLVDTVPHDYSGTDATVCTDCGHHKSGMQIATPTVSVSGDTASWKKIAGASGYRYTITDHKGVLVKTGKIGSNVSADLYVVLAEGQSVIVQAIPSNNENFDSNYSTKATRNFSAVSNIVNILNGVENYVQILNAIQATDIVGAKALVDASFTADDTQSLSVYASAMLDGTTPNNSRVLADIVVNQKTFLSVGYVQNKVLIREPFNLLHSDDTALQSFYMDSTLLQPSVEALVTLGMQELANLPDYSLASFIEEAKSVLQDVDGLIHLDNLLSFANEENGVVIGVSCGALNTLLGLLPTILEDDTAVSAFGEDFDAVVDIIRLTNPKAFLLSDGSRVTWDYICKKIALNANREKTFLQLSVYYDQNDTIEKLALLLDFAALDSRNVGNNALVTVEVPIFGINETVDVPVEDYEEKDLSLSFDLDLGNTDLTATVDAKISLSHAFRSEDSVWGVGTMTITDKNGSAVVRAFVDGKGASVDFSDLFTYYGIENPAVYYQSFEALLGYSIPDYINAEAIAYADSILAPAPQNASAVIPPKIRDFLLSIGNLPAGQTVFQYYLKFSFDHTSFQDFWAEIQDIHATTDYQNTLVPATTTEKNKFGVNIFGNPSLFAYLSYFVAIPAVKEGRVDYSKTEDLNDAAAWRNWIDCVFPQTNKVRQLVEALLGESLDDVFSDDLYFEAEAFERLDGKISFKHTSEGEAFFSLRGKITMIEPVPAEELVAGAWDTSDCHDFTERKNSEYVCVRALKELAKAFMNQE